MRLYAHTTAGPETEWEELEAHLLAVGKRAASMAGRFGAAEFGLATGLLHDLGKAKPDWQRYLVSRGQRASVPHAGEGARAAVERYDAIHLGIGALSPARTRALPACAPRNETWSASGCGCTMR